MAEKVEQKMEEGQMINKKKGKESMEERPCDHEVQATSNRVKYPVKSMNLETKAESWR